MNSGHTSYFCSNCPVCHQKASRADRGLMLAEFHCSDCGSFEIARAAILPLSRRRLSQRMLWLRQVRRFRTRMLDDDMAAAFS